MRHLEGRVTCHKTIRKGRVTRGILKFRKNQRGGGNSLGLCLSSEGGGGSPEKRGVLLVVGGRGGRNLPRAAKSFDDHLEHQLNKKIRLPTTRHTAGKMVKRISVRLALQGRI